MDGDRNRRADGYRGIWFALGQLDGEYGDKYSGGLGTYTMKHVPMAVHDPESERTFFTYGGTVPGERDLRIMVGTFDHQSETVRRPTLVDPKDERDASYDAETVRDPHDNASLCLDGAGRLWVFVAGRGRRRPGRIYRAKAPGDAGAFELVAERELFAYPQPWRVGGEFFCAFTIYDEAGTRELFWIRGDGEAWSEPRKLAGIGGHYQVSERHPGTEAVVTAFNWHPEGDVDRRTNLYVLRTPDGGDTWETVDGTRIAPPLTEPDNPALVREYAAEDRLVYLNDIAYDAAGNPAVLYVTSGDYAPGPAGDPRRWVLSRWTGAEWVHRTVTTSDHNYDSGSLYPGDPRPWRVFGPTEPGPQPYHTGGEMAVWRSDDGDAWTRERTVTEGSERNHTYARRPRPAVAPFEVFWADGDASGVSESRLYFGRADGSAHWRLPEQMDAEWERPPRLG